MSQPHEHTRASRLAAKRDILHETARDFTRGTATDADLEESAVEFSEALISKAYENIRARKP